MNTIHENEYDTLVLSGSSSKVIAILGSLQFLYDNNRISNIENYIGTSSGFIVSFLLIIGYTPIEILVYIFTNRIMENMQEFNIQNFLAGKGGMCWNENIGKQLIKMCLSKIGFIPTLKDIYDKFSSNIIAVTFNLSTNSCEFLNKYSNPDLSCIDAARMSSNLPFLFDKYKYNDHYYVDGGIINNFAIEKGEEIGKKIIGIVSINEYSDNIEKNNKVIENENQLNLIYKLITTSISHITHAKLDSINKNTVTLLKIPCGGIKTYDFKIDTKLKFSLFSSGYDSSKNQFSNI